MNWNLKDLEKKHQIKEDLNYNQKIRLAQRSEKKLEAIISDYRIRAMQAEKGGQHALAVKLAKEATRLDHIRQASSQMRGTVESTKAVSDANRQLSGMISLVNGIVDQIYEIPSTQDIMALQLSCQQVKEQMDLIIEEHDAMFSDDLEPASLMDEAGEAALREIMKSRAEKHQERSRTLQFVNQALDNRQKARDKE